MPASAHHSAHLKGAALVAAAAGLWSTTSVVARFAFIDHALPPLVLGFVRLAIASPIFILLMLQLNGGREVLPENGAWPFLIGLGLAQGAYQALFLAAISLVGAGLPTLIALCFAPVMTALLSGVLLGERVTRRTVEGMFGAIIGTAMVVTYGETLVVGKALGEGIVLSLAAGLVYAVFTLLSRGVGKRCHPFQSAGFGFALGALFLLPFAMWSTATGASFRLNAGAMTVIAYIVLVPTLLGYIAFFQGMRVTPAILSSIIITLEPMAAAALAWLFLGERLGVGGTLGAALLTVAVLWVTLEPRGNAAHKTPN